VTSGAVRALFEGVAEVERLDVPWGPGPFPTYLIRDRPGASRVVVVQRGLTAPLSDMLDAGVLDLVARGWSAVAFDGPGQSSSRVMDGTVPPEDWAAVIAAVLDAVQARAEHPGEFARVALVGLDDGAVLALQATARDPRVVALVCDPGVIRPLDGALAQLPRNLVVSWREKDDDATRFQRFVTAAVHDRAIAVAVDKIIEAWPDHTLYDVLTRLDAWDASPLLDDVGVPVLICDTDSEAPYAGQPAELAKALGSRATLLDPMSRPDRTHRIQEWLDEVVPETG
jgi:pimeloyl-ACP methyl ester carboxylesterase